MTIAILNLNHLGDALFTTPALEALRSAYSGARLLHWAAAPTAPLFEADPRLDVKVTRGTKPQLQWLRQALALRSRWKPETVVSFCDNSLGLALAARCLGGRLRVGYVHRATRGSFHRTIPFSRSQGHVADSHLALVRLLGIPAEPGPLRMLLPEHAAQAAEALLDRAGLEADTALLALCLGASRPNKRWSPERFAQVARWWQERGGGVVLVGGQEDAEAARVVLRSAGGRALDACGEPLAISCGLLHRARLAVSADTGPLHMAAALGTPVVALFGPTDPARTGPYRASSVVLRHTEGCPGCAVGEKAEGHRCMDALLADEVIEAVRELDAASEPRAGV